MTKLIRLLILSASMVLVLASCSFPGTTTKNPLLPAIPVLTLTASANPLIYDQIGQVITYTYVIKNTGTSNLGPAQFTVSDGLIGPAPFNCGDANTSLIINATVTCSATYTITAADLTAVSIKNLATASGDGVGPSPSAGVTINKSIKALTLTTSANPTTYNQTSQVITYTYVIMNSGNTTLGPAQFTVSDSLLSTNPFNCGDANTSLAPNTTVSCTATYSISSADLTAGSVTNITTASGGSAGSSASISTTITKGTIAQSNPNLVAGSTIKHQVVSGEWLIQIARCYGANYDSVRAANPQLSNPAEISPETTITVPNIGSDGKIYGKPCVGTHTVQPGDTWNSIALKYNADSTVLQTVNLNNLAVGRVLKVPCNSAGGPAASCNLASGTPTTVSTTLALTTTAIPNIFDQIGQVITFTYIIKNIGTLNLGPAQFTVNDTLIGAPFNCGAATITLAPNATVTCTATYTIAAADLTAVSVKNLASASGGGAGPSPSISATINKGIKALTLSTSANPITYNQTGQVLTFTYVILNSGNMTLGPAQFTVSDALIGGAPFNCGTAAIVLAPNSTVTCNATYTITATNMTTPAITNFATASGGGAGPSPSVGATINKQ